MSAVPFEVLTALGRLNAHARAFGCGKRAIYEYKALASAVAILAGQAGVTLRQWTGECHGCGGTGRYVDSYGEKWPHCRACGSTGRVTLKFVEVDHGTSGQVWHHPFENGAGWDLAALADVARWDGQRGGWRDHRGNEPIFWNFANGWAPKQPGRRLEADEAAQLLNVVEAWVLTKPAAPVLTMAADRFPWMRDRAEREMRRYVLDLGRLEGPCYRCGNEDVVCGLGRSGPPLAFAAPVCRDHKQIEVALWPTSIPDTRLTPALIEWRDRHVALGFDREDRWGA